MQGNLLLDWLLGAEVELAEEQLLAEAMAPLLYSIEAIVVSGTLAYVTSGGAGLRMVVSEQTAKLSAGSDGLRLIDVSGPISPTGAPPSAGPTRRSTALTRAISSRTLSGLVTQSSAPFCSPTTRSISSSQAASMMIGTLDNTSALSRCNSRWACR